MHSTESAVMCTDDEVGGKKLEGGGGGQTI